MAANLREDIWGISKSKIENYTCSVAIDGSERKVSRCIHSHQRHGIKTVRHKIKRGTGMIAGPGEFLRNERMRDGTVGRAWPPRCCRVFGGRGQTSGGRPRITNNAKIKSHPLP